VNEVLRIADLSYAWPGQAAPTVVLDELVMAPGERVFLYGPSGSGKSTLLALIAGLIKPQQGQITLLGERVDQRSAAARDRLRANQLGIIFQQFNLLPYLDVLSNVCLPCRFSKPRAQRAGDVKSAAERLLQAMDLPAELWDRRADQLSVGQQQRVAAARALIGQPAMVLADEPTSSLDSDRQLQFLALLFEQVAASGSALLFVSHDLKLASQFDRQLDLAALNQAEVAA
jgi:putative ABC transport system ATP-binding protein